MKAGNDNYRSSSIQGIMSPFKTKGLEEITHETALIVGKFYGNVVNDLVQFKFESYVIEAKQTNNDARDIASRPVAYFFLGGIK
jgi:hypothetical protein